ERELVAYDPRVASDLLRALRMPEEVRVVALLPDQHEMSRGHEVGDEAAARRRARERIGPHAEPAAVIVAIVLVPELFLGLLVEPGYRLTDEELGRCSAFAGWRNESARSPGRQSDPVPKVRLTLGGSGLPPERDAHARSFRIAEDHELDLVARLVRGDRVAEL